MSKADFVKNLRQTQEKEWALRREYGQLHRDQCEERKQIGKCFDKARREQLMERQLQR